MSGQETKQDGFAVTDRRGFTAEGEARAAKAPAPTTPAVPPVPPVPPAAAATTAPVAHAPVEPPAAPIAADGGASFDSAGAPRTPGDLPPLDFGTFVLSLGSSALVHLGEAPAEAGQAPARDLALAKHTIDLLSMLEEKTRGNLTPPEQELLDSLLYDLRLRYVGAARAR